MNFIAPKLYSRLNDEEFIKKLNGFSPVFGNERHIRIITYLDDLSEKMDEQDEAKSEKKIERIVAEVRMIKNQIMFLLEEDK